MLGSLSSFFLSARLTSIFAACDDENRTAYWSPDNSLNKPLSIELSIIPLSLESGLLSDESKPVVGVMDLARSLDVTGGSA